ncbi:PP2C family protein-serine/threonine phosphatase [Nocardioides sp. Bht2]|uniref:PP2C family protein-serine/threonine phosphatase n=1 Tax=Nocardioides sp. Bht2 TaxID=3392297 RepID=UPI0039B52D7C
MVHLNCGAATHVGWVRSTNQDAYLAAAPVFVVADGMGGHQGGEVASAIVIEEFARLVQAGFEPREAIGAVARALALSQDRIAQHVAEHQRDGAVSYYAGTTVAAALVCADEEGPKWLLVNLGDSRIYKVHQDRVEQVSVDHSVVQELVDSGTITSTAAASHPERHVITRALSAAGRTDPDYFVLPLASAQRLLICSDGVSGMVAPDVLASVLIDVADPRDAADAVVAAALSGGGEDNATAIVVDVVGWSEADSPRNRSEPVSLEEKLGALP